MDNVQNVLSTYDKFCLLWMDYLICFGVTERNHLIMEKRVFESRVKGLAWMKQNLPYILLVLAFLISIGVVGLLYMSFWIAPVIDTDDYSMNDGSVIYAVDVIETRENAISITGWAARLDVAIQNFDTYFALYDSSNDEYRRIKSTMQIREDVPEALGVTVDIKNCGILGVVDKRLLTPEAVYEVCILYGNDDAKVLIHTGIKIDGKGDLIDESNN